MRCKDPIQANLPNTFNDLMRRLENFLEGFEANVSPKNWCFGSIYARNFDLILNQFFSETFVSKPSKKFSRRRMRSFKVFGRFAQIRSLQRTKFYGHTTSQSFFIEANVSHWLFSPKNQGKTWTTYMKMGLFPVKPLLQRPLKNFLDIA